MSTKVYIVTSGSYSDYGIRGVFLDKAAAEAWVAEHNERKARYRDDYEIEEWDADKPREEFNGCYSVTVDKNGSVVADETQWSDYHAPSEPARLIAQRFGINGPPPNLPHFEGFGPTVEHARRSAEELRRATLTGNVVA